MKPYSFFGLLLVLGAALLAFYSLNTWSHRFALLADAQLAANSRSLDLEGPDRLQPKPLIDLLEPRAVRVELPGRG